VKGLEWRENYQEESHAEILINADLSRGYLEARQGFAPVGSVGGQALFMRLHATNYPTYDPAVLSVGLASVSGNTSLYAAVYDASGSVVSGSVQVIATGLSSDIDNFRCSFVDHTLPNDDGFTRYVTLISTSVGHFVYDPQLSPGAQFRDLNPAETSAGGDTIRINDLNFAYHLNLLPAYISTEHQGRIYRAGYRGAGMTAKLSRGIEENQTLIPEGDLKNRNGARDELALGPHHITYSDEFDPAAIQAHHAFSVEEREVVTGLKSFQERLVIFTDRSIYVKTGGTDDTFAIQKLVSGVGCVAHNSIIEVQGILYFQSKDGVYGWQGGTQAQKLSFPIDELWTGRYQRTFVPAAMEDTLTDIGYPYVVSHADMRFCNVMHYQTRNQIWWSLPVQSRASRSMPLTLVWDYNHNAWSMYVMRPKGGTNGDMATCMYDGIVVRLSEGQETVLTSSCQGTNGTLQIYGGDRTDPGTGSIGIPLVWLSARLWKGNVRFNKRRPCRFNLLSTGKTPASNPPKYVLVGEEAHFVDVQGSVTTEQSDTIATHPDPDGVGSNVRYGTWGTLTWSSTGSRYSSKDWFWTKEEGSVKSRSVRVGIVDDADDQDRAPLVSLQAYNIASEAGGDTR
jgi:hypothetical protein